MSESSVRVAVHLVWSTKGRVGVVGAREEQEIQAAAAEQLARLVCPLIAFGASDDHVHVLFWLSPLVPIVDVARSIKSASAVRVNKLGGVTLRWQTGYAASSVTPSALDVVARYVRSQRLHHAAATTAEEWERIA